MPSDYDIKKGLNVIIDTLNGVVNESDLDRRAAINELNDIIEANTGNPTVIIQDNGTVLPYKKTLNFIGTTVTNDTLNNRINIAIPTTTSLVKASTSAGVFLRSNNDTLVAEFGQGGGSNFTFEGNVRLNAGTASRVLVTNGTKDLTASTVTQAELETLINNNKRLYYNKEDFIDGFGRMTSRGVANSGVFTLTNTSSPSGWFGTLTLATTASATSSAGVRAEASDWMGKGSGITTLTTKFIIDTLSDGTDTYTLRVGFLDTVSAESNNGIFLRYGSALNSGKFQFVTRSTGTETATDTGITVASATEYTLIIGVNSALNSITCTINGSLVATNTTTIPGKGLGSGYGIMMLRSAGTATRRVHADFFEMIIP
jgi:hypothetical protein